MFSLSPLPRRLLAVISVALVVLCCAPAPRTLAQTTSGTLVGTVYKPTGEPVAGARVVATNELNGNSRATITAADGSYRIPFMPPGRYTIRASETGFTDSQITGFPIPLNSTTNLVPPITLGQPGATPVTTPIGQTPTTPAGAPTEGEARASLVNTNDPTRRGNFAREQVETLPLGGTTDTRTFDELALLVPGVTPAPYVPGVRGPGVGFGIGTAGQFSVNGARARSNNFTVDGSDNNDPDVGVRRQGFVALVPQSIESVQEFQLSTLLWDAEEGRNSGSQVNAVSKSGGNDFHGMLYGFFTDSALNARNAFDFTGGPSQGEDPYTRVQAGFVLGGPIAKDKTQFFTSYERLEINASVEQHFATPTAAERRFLGLPAFAVLRPFPAAPATLGFTTMVGATPIGNNVLSLYPLPNNPGGPYGENTYTEVMPASGDGNIFSFKVTHKFNDDNVFNARYNFTKDNRILPSVNRAIRSTINSDTTTNNLSLILDTALSPTLFNQARFSYGRTKLSFPEYPASPFIFEASSVVGIDTPQGTVGFTSDTFPIGELEIQPYSPVGVDVFTFPQGRTNNTFQYADSVSWTRGRHSVKFGADIRYNQLNSFQDRNYRPLVQFGNGLQAFGFLNLQQGDPNRPFGFTALSNIVPLSGVQLAAFGAPSSLFQVITEGPPDSSIRLRFTEYDFFVNDSWRIRPNFVLDYGVRYEYNTVPTEADNKIEDSLQLMGVPQPGGSSLDTPLSTFAYNQAVAALGDLNGGRTKIYENDPNNFGPHLGFAWDPWSDGRTSIRGGYGIYFDSILGAVVSQSRNQFPDEIPVNVTPSFLGTDILNLPNPAVLAIRDAQGNIIRQLIAPGTVNQFGGNPEDFAALIGRVVAQNFNTGGISTTIPVNDLATPYVQQWHLTLEHQFLSDYVVSVAYVGTKGTKLTRLTTPNLGPNVTPFLPVAVAAPGTPYTEGPPLVVADVVQSIIRPRPEPFLGAIQRFENSANSIYHSLQVEARKRFNHGYMFTFAYTWSHAIDDVSDVFPIAGASNLPEDTFNLALERGDANFDVRHRFATSVIWDLPFYRDRSDAGVGSAAWLLGGWQISTIAQGNTGQPFTLQVPIDANLDGNLTDRPLTTNGLSFITAHGAQRVAIEDNPNVANYVFFPAFSFSPSGQLTVVGQDGAVGRNTVRADGLVDWDLALNKRFRFTETQNLEFRTEVFNLLNRTNYGIPVRTLFSPGFGFAIDTATPARIIQFALKYSF